MKLLNSMDWKMSGLDQSKKRRRFKLRISERSVLVPLGFS
jgi:hypothetical protein